MAKAPELKYIAQGVTDLHYATEFFSDFFNFKKFNSTGFKNDGINFHLYYEKTSEFLSVEGGAFLQFVEAEDAKLNIFEPDLSEIGILGVKIKTRKIDSNFFMRRREDMTSQPDIWIKPLKKRHFHVFSENLLFQIIDSSDNFFATFSKQNGGVGGAILGVSDIEKSFDFYSKILGYNKVIYKGNGVYEDFKNLKGGCKKYKRMIIQQSENQEHKFLEYFGKSEIELLEVQDSDNRKTLDFDFSSLNFITSNINDIVGTNYNLGRIIYQDEKDDSVIHFFDPDGIKISVQKIDANTKGVIPNDLKILFKLIKP